MHAEPQCSAPKLRSFVDPKSASTACDCSPRYCLNSVNTAAAPTTPATATAPSPVLRLKAMFCPMTLSHACRGDGFFRGIVTARGASDTRTAQFHASRSTSTSARRREGTSTTTTPRAVHTPRTARATHEVPQPAQEVVRHGERDAELDEAVQDGVLLQLVQVVAVRLGRGDGRDRNEREARDEEAARAAEDDGRDHVLAETVNGLCWGRMGWCVAVCVRQRAHRLLWAR